MIVRKTVKHSLKSIIVVTVLLIATGCNQSETAKKTGVQKLNPPDLVVYNADVRTVDENMPQVEAFAVRDGKFLAVGTNDEIRKLANSNTVLKDGYLGPNRRKGAIG